MNHVAKWVFKNHRPYDLYRVKEEKTDTFNDIKPLKNIRRLVEKETAGKKISTDHDKIANELRRSDPLATCWRQGGYRRREDWLSSSMTLWLLAKRFLKKVVLVVIW